MSNLNDEVNIRLIKDYTLKRYDIVKLHPSMDAIFDLYEYESMSLITKWVMMSFLCDIFSVDQLIVKEVFSQIIKEKRREKIGEVNY